MKLYAPRYYADFSCIADRCRHNCCVGWEIDIDPDTARLYEGMSEGYGACIAQSMDTSTEPPHFRLTREERCPHLDASGLCRIILSLGEEALCEICREHPRFYHRTTVGLEVGIGMACEEASRVILSSPDYARMIQIDEWETEEGIFMSDFNPLEHRARVYRSLSDTDVEYSARLTEIAHEYGVTPTALTDAKWREVLSGLEYLEEDDRARFAVYSNNEETPSSLAPLLERALAYFVFRHCSDACDKEEFRASLGLALFLERLLCAVARNEGRETLADVADIARVISAELEYSEENTEAIRRVFADVAD